MTVINRWEREKEKERKNFSNGGIKLGEQRRVYEDHRSGTNLPVRTIDLQSPPSDAPVLSFPCQTISIPLPLLLCVFISDLWVELSWSLYRLLIIMWLIDVYCACLPVLLNGLDEFLWWNLWVVKFYYNWWNGVLIFYFSFLFVSLLCEYWNYSSQNKLSFNCRNRNRLQSLSIKSPQRYQIPYFWIIYIWFCIIYAFFMIITRDDFANLPLNF